MKDFEEIYENVLGNKNELEDLRKNYITRILLTVIVSAVLVIACFLFANETIAMIALFIAIVLGAYIIYKPGKEYKMEYKEKVVKTFIKEYDENLEYAPESGISSSTYRMAGFENRFDRYHSEDLITGKIDGHQIEMSEVHTEEEQESTDSDGNTTTTYVTLFYGMFGHIQINNIYNGEMKIHSDKGKLAKLFGDKQRIEMDSSEFEKYFDVYAEDKIQAMQVLTSDIIEEMIDFRTNHKTKFEITINGNQLYIRFHTGDMFEANLIKSSTNEKTLREVYDIINFTFDITRKFIKISEDTEI